MCAVMSSSKYAAEMKKYKAMRAAGFTRCGGRDRCHMRVRHLEIVRCLFRQ